MSPPLQRPARPERKQGIDLKHAETLTRRLLLTANTTPTYHLPPSVSTNLPIPLQTFLKTGFDALPPSLDPGHRNNGAPVPSARASKKRAQISALLRIVAALLSDNRMDAAGQIFDLCGGCGHTALVLAYALPSYRVTLVDANKTALSVAASRAAAARLGNFATLNATIETLRPRKAALVLALHACGGASDIALAYAARCNAAFVVTPCCVGGLVSSKTAVSGAGAATPATGPDGSQIDWQKPRSELFRALLTDDEYVRLARAADYAELLSGRDAWRGVAKAMLEQDRMLWLLAQRYCVRLVKIPAECTPKNDVLVGWDGAAMDASLDAQWLLDDAANAVIRDVREGSVIRGFSVEEIRTVEAVLKEHVLNNPSGSYAFPETLGSRERKAVHAVAESLGLYHISSGKGSSRFVSVSRTEFWPVFFDGFVGIGGQVVEQLCASLNKFVPKACRERRGELRGDSHHVTIVSPREIPQLAYRYKHDTTALLRNVYERLQGTSFCVHGIGRAAKSVRRHGDVSIDGSLYDERFVRESELEHVDNEAYFAVVTWPEADQLRTDLGLGLADFHITLGFSEKDIYNVAKDQSTILHRKEGFCSPWKTS